MLKSTRRVFNSETVKVGSPDMCPGVLFYGGMPQTKEAFGRVIFVDHSLIGALLELLLKENNLPGLCTKG